MTLFNPFLRTVMALACLIFTATISAEEQMKRVLMVVSAYGANNGETAPGYEFDEFAKAYLVFKQHDIYVDVASPKGGPVEADEFDPASPYNARVIADNAIMTKLNNTLSTAELDAATYDGIFIVGGKGAMFDLPKDTSLQHLIAEVYQQQGTIAAVCHGPAALVNVKLSDGQYLVANKAVVGFTNKEEKLFGTKWLNDFDFMLEDKLIERGGRFESSDIMLSHVTVDGHLITGQNPSSTVAVATELVKSFDIKVKPSEQYKDDRTLAVVAQILDEDTSAVNTLMSNQGHYNMQLIGMYGYFYLKTAANDAELKNALGLMKLGQAAINNPKLDMKIAKTQQTLGDHKSATQTLKQVLAKQPDFKPAQEMLNTLALSSVK